VAVLALMFASWWLLVLDHSTNATRPLDGWLASHSRDNGHVGTAHAFARKGAVRSNRGPIAKTAADGCFAVDPKESGRRLCRRPLAWLGLDLRCEAQAASRTATGSGLAICCPRVLVVRAAIAAAAMRKMLQARSACPNPDVTATGCEAWAASS
jgi:hypothetical protein